MPYCYTELNDVPESALVQMKTAAREVAYDTFMRRVGWNQLKSAPFFDGRSYARNGHKGRSFRQDWKAMFYRSEFQGRACYFVIHSGSCCVFVADEAPVIEAEPLPIDPVLEPLALIEETIRRADYESGCNQPIPEPHFTLPRGKVNPRHCWLVRLILRAVRAFTERKPRENRFSWISLAIGRFNGPVIYEQEAR